MVINETCIGLEEWLKEETEIVDVETGEVLVNAEIRKKKSTNILIENYIIPRLRSKGVIFKKDK